MKQEAETEMLKEYAEKEYKYGFVTDIESDTLPPGLNEDVITEIAFNAFDDSDLNLSVSSSNNFIFLSFE